MGRDGARPEGFDAEWRIISLGTVEGDLINRTKLFDAVDLDAALARFEQAHPTCAAIGKRGEPSKRARIQTYFSGRNFDAAGGKS